MESQAENTENKEVTQDNVEQQTQDSQATDFNKSEDYHKAFEVLDEETAFNFLKQQKGLNDVNSFDDLLKPKEVNPYEDYLDDDDRAYLNFKKETGRSRKDFEALNANLDEIPRIELARERVRKEAGVNLSNEEVDEYISHKLGITDIDDLSASEKIELAAYTKSILDEKKAEQEKYRTPIQKEQPQTKEQQSQDNEEWVKLETGAVMRKSDYDNLVNSRLSEIEKAKEAVNSVTASDFKLTIDDKGTQKELNFAYEYSEEDKQSMVSIVSDVDSVIKARYSSEQGFNHKQFAEDLQWSDPKFREKAIASILHKAIAGNTEAFLKERGNVNFTHDSLPKQTKEGVKIVSMADAVKGNY